MNEYAQGEDAPVATRRKTNPRIRKFAVIGGTVTMSLVGGAALAYWTQSGSGSGSATADTTAAITVYQTSTVSTLRPGGPSGALSGDFTNPNPGSVTISSITATVDAFSSQTNVAKPPCTQADFAIGGTSGSNVVPTGTRVGSWSGLTVSLVDNGLNQDNCKVKTVSISYTANP